MSGKLGALPPPLAGEGWGGGWPPGEGTLTRARICVLFSRRGESDPVTTRTAGLLRDEVTLSRKGAKSRTRVRAPRSTGTKARTRAGRGRNAFVELERRLERRTRELAQAREHACRSAGAAGGDVRGAAGHLELARRAGAGVPGHAGEGDAHLRGQVRQSAAVRWQTRSDASRCTTRRLHGPSVAARTRDPSGPEQSSRPRRWRRSRSYTSPTSGPSRLTRRRGSAGRGSPTSPARER